MPTVPVEQPGGGPTPNSLQGPQVNRMLLASVGAGGREMEQMGQGLLRLGNENARDQINAIDMANQVRVNDALNQAREAQMTLTYGTSDDPSTGYLAQKGKDALERSSGQPLADEYTGKLQDAISNISASLGNDAQRRVFQMHANDMLANFQGDLQKHTLQEFHNYALSTQDGTLKLAADNAQLNWNDPDKIGQSIEQAKAAVYQTGKLTGAAASETQARILTATSAIHTSVIQAALENDNPLYAMQYLQTKKGEMTATDILKVNGVINREVDNQVATIATQNTVKQFASKFAPTDYDRLHSLVAQQESGNADFKADGTPVASPKGALYKYQVMPATAANPGFGIQPAKDNSPAEYNRVGQQYLDALVQKYGNINQALAAYNAGPGAVDAAVKAGGANWLSKLPKETQNYVNAIGSQFTAGAGAPQMPTKQQFVDTAIAQLGSNPRPEQVKLTQQQAEHQYGLMIDARKQQGDQALLQAQQKLIANGGDFNALDQQTRTMLAQTDPDNYKKAQEFAKSISKGPNATNPEAYAMLATYPDELAKLSDAQFMQLKTQLSDDDFKHFANERANILNGKTDNTAGALNTKALNTVLSERLSNLQIDPAPKKNDAEGMARVGAIQKFVRDDIFEQQQQLGRKMTPQEISDRVDHLFARNVTFQNTFMGFNTSKETVPLMGLKWGDVPSDVRDAIEQRMPNATEGDKLRAYWTWMKKRNG